jgi:hypothetical protein
LCPAPLLKSATNSNHSEILVLFLSTFCQRNHLCLWPVSNISTLPLTPPVPPPKQTPAPTDAPPRDPDAEPGLGELILEELESAVPHNPETLSGYVPDPESKRQGGAVLGEEILWQVWNACIRSRVLKDPFHIFNMFYISVTHGL